jgi:hypothetical protein
MSLVPLTSEAEIQRAHNAMLATLRRGCSKYHRLIGWQGGSGEETVEWNTQEYFILVQTTLLSHT